MPSLFQTVPAGLFHPLAAQGAPIYSVDRIYRHPSQPVRRLGGPHLRTPTVGERRYPTYYAEHSAAPRRETNAALQELASREVVRLGWRRWEEGNWLKTVDLIPAHTATVYTLLGRTLRNTREEALRLLLAGQPRVAGWRARFISWAEARLDRVLARR
jgi:hypothetical protein